ncbi:MAG: hypothetical protein KAT70_08555 [Thermoplasmata archaeon]|nr:hypothetical protein [Thermoplasmata archaeon]
MNKDTKPTIMMGMMMCISHLLAISLVLPFKDYYQDPKANPDDPSLLFLYLGFMLLVTGILLLVFKYGLDKGLKYILYFMFGMIIFTVLQLPLAFLLWYSGAGPLSGDLGALAAIVITVVLMAVYAVKKVWYLTNVIGILIAGGSMAILGVNFSILPIFLFLIALAIYDYIAVYKTKHMLTLAEGIIPMGVPILLSVPKTGVKLKPGHIPKVKLTEKKSSGKVEKAPERDAMYMGLGDIILPGLLVISAIAFLPMHATLGKWGAGIVAFSTLSGILVSYIGLAWLVMKGKPQAGLPFLNTGAICGYIVGYILIFQNLSLGMNFSW